MRSTVQYLRMDRSGTGSYITVALPVPMEFSDACEWAEKNYQGWETVSGSLGDFDVQELEDDAISEAVIVLRAKGVVVHSLEECAHRIRGLILTLPLKSKYDAIDCDFWVFAQAVWSLYCATRTT